MDNRALLEEAVQMLNDLLIQAHRVEYDDDYIERRQRAMERIYSAGGTTYYISKLRDKMLDELKKEHDESTLPLERIMTKEEREALKKEYPNINLKRLLITLGICAAIVIACKVYGL